METNETMSDFYEHKKVLVTGAAGLIGSAFIKSLLDRGALVRVVERVRHVECGDEVERVRADLRVPSDCRRVCRGIDFVIHGAGVSGGSKQVMTNPHAMFTDSLLMNTNIIEAARAEGVRRFLFISNSSVYPRGKSRMHERDAWGDGPTGPPENATGMVKRVGEVQAALYHAAGAFDVAIIRTGNAYGPGDNFDLDSSHVVPALIRKAVERQHPFVIWGDGEPVRDFIHTSDIASGGLYMLEHYATADPVNISCDAPVTIEELAQKVRQLAGYHDAEVLHQRGAPPASQVKLLSISKMRSLGFAPAISLNEGLASTISWYREHGG